MPPCNSTAILPKAKVVWIGDHYSIFQKDCIYLLLKEGEGRRRSRREMLMCHRNINRLPLTCPQPGTWPATQARALTRNWTSYPFALWDDAQPTEPCWSGQDHYSSCSVMVSDHSQGKENIPVSIILIRPHILKVGKKFQEALIPMKRHGGLNFTWFVPRDTYTLIFQEVKQ